MSWTYVVSPDAPSRLDAARAWLKARPTTERVWVIGATREASASLVRSVVRAQNKAAFGWEPLFYGALIARLALVPLAADGRTPTSRLGAEAIAARVVHARLSGETSPNPSRFAPVESFPGFARALANTLRELRLTELNEEDLRALEPDLAELTKRFDAGLRSAQLADRADALRKAVDAAAAAPLDAVLWVDVGLTHGLEGRLIDALTSGRDAFVCAAERDLPTQRVLSDLGRPEPTRLPSLAEGALGRLQSRLFAEVEDDGLFEDASAASSSDASAGSNGADDEGVVLLAAPGESAECIEIARRVLRHAQAGVPFDRMAIVLRAPTQYRAHLGEVFRRAGIPLRLTPGTVRPDPTGRALLALLTCKREGYSARAFAEYLSLAVAPADPDREIGWVRPDPDLLPFQTLTRTDGLEDLFEAPKGRMVRLPREWEKFLVDAVVIGGRARWERRLDRHDRELELKIDSLVPDDPRRSSLQIHRTQLRELRTFALPLLDALAELPESAPWSEWLASLERLAGRALATPERVLQVLGELAPLGPVGPVGLGEVQVVLESRLTQLVDREATGDGVLVVGTDEARGLEADVVFVPGLAEGSFPAKVLVDPLLSDERRRSLSVDLATRDSKLAEERLALALAIGMARREVVVSWPEIDLKKGRPRVPSLHALEVARAVWGELPAYQALADAARGASAAGIGWPAPRDPLEAIDEAEFDLAMVRQLVHADESEGGMAYLLDESPHLARALRQRHGRLGAAWSRADGLVVRDPKARPHLDVLAFETKVYSPTALQRLAKCPYQFALYSVFKLSPREVPEAIEDLDPLQRGSMIHDIQFDVLMALRERGALPLLTAEALAAARDVLDETIAEVAAEYAEELAPAIPRVWEGAVEVIRQDLHEWLSRLHADPSWEPLAFELSFGITRGTRRDPRSVSEPVELRELGIRLRGSIDLVEARMPTGEELEPVTMFRATDSKTGRKPQWMKDDLTIGGGRALQPLLYAAVLEALGGTLVEGEIQVVGGRLYYCTSRGGFRVVDAALDARSRAVVAKVPEVLRWSRDKAFFPPAPIDGECRYCDYQPVCGPDVLVHLARKTDRARLGPIETLRGLK